MTIPTHRTLPMIKFACHCHKHTFAVGEELAGDVVQCPRCGRLNDVPNKQDLAAIDEDGAYKLGDALVAPPTEETLARMNLAFTRRRFDDAGNEIDLRIHEDDMIGIGGETLPLADEVAIDRPQYDPLTGELIRLIGVKRDANELSPSELAKIPIAKPVQSLQYAAVRAAGPLGFKQILSELSKPANVFVMGIILFMHVFVQPVMVMMQAGLFLVAPLWIAAIMFFLSHYGNVIDETGPSSKDELPRPLREVSLSEDIWNPFVAVAFSLIVSFFPMSYAYNHGAPWWACFALALVAGYLFPALVLTATTSGTTFNLRPDRVLGVMRIIGAKYLLLSIAFLVALALYTLGLWRLDFDSIVLFVPSKYAVLVRASVAWWFKPWIAYPALFIGIVLMHAFGWSMGACYRLHHEQFPWILQRHIKVHREKKITRIARNPSANSQRAKQALNR